MGPDGTISHVSRNYEDDELRFRQDQKLAEQDAELDDLVGQIKRRGPKEARAVEGILKFYRQYRFTREEAIEQLKQVLKALPPKARA